MFLGKMMTEQSFVPPRQTPDRDSKYMGLAWIHAAFSKDPSTQVGSVVISKDNKPLGSGYNGPPDNIDDNSFSWQRPPVDDPEAFSKYDTIVHAEANAIDHSHGEMLIGSTLYCLAMPCRDCMKEIIRKKIARVVYMDHKSDKNSMLQKNKDKSIRLASLAGVKLEIFKGNLNWLPDWISKMKALGAFEM